VVGARAAGAQVLDLPPRPPDAPGGAEMAAQLRGLDLEAREARIYAEIARGNVPDWLRELVPVETSREVDGRTFRVSFRVTPDYLAVGSASDFLRVPLTPGTAQRIANLVGASLPTPRMVDAVWTAARVRLAPDSLPPDPTMTTVPVFLEHQRRIEARRALQHAPPGSLVAGHKKDVVLTPRLASDTGKVAIYGWHRPDGRPIQPLYTGHTSDWVDYSHGIRLVERRVVIDGTPWDLLDVLRDPVLARVLSDEGVIAEPRYPVGR
jgi:hypothetical protein